MKVGNINIIIFFFILFFLKINFILAADKIESVPLINLEDLSPTFEEEKDELDKIEDKSSSLKSEENVNDSYSITGDDKIYIRNFPISIRRMNKL